MSTLDRSKKKLSLGHPSETKSCRIGMLHISYQKKSIFLTLTDMEGKVRASIYSASLFKKKIRLAEYIFKELSLILKQVVQKLQIKLLVIKIQGRQKLKIQRLLLSGLFRKKRVKKNKKSNLQVRSLTYLEKSAHNGCRPRKLRRK
jgi:ribosomal protein S11